MYLVRLTLVNPFETSKGKKGFVIWDKNLVKGSFIPFFSRKTVISAFIILSLLLLMVNVSKSTLYKFSNKNFKVYIGNDASPNNPSELLSKYENDFNFEYFEFQENLGSKSLKGSYHVCLGGFGVGLTWSLIKCKLENLQFCEIINY